MNEPYATEPYAYIIEWFRFLSSPQRGRNTRRLQ